MLIQSTHVLIGIAFISLGAFIDGALGLALKYTRVWKWEHLWLVYSVLAFSVIPWVLGFTTIGHLTDILKQASGRDVFLVLLFGFAWGFGAVFFGLSLKMAGMALSYAIAVGLGAAVGSFAPLVLFHWEDIFSLRGRVVIGAVLLAVIGVILCSWSGHLKELRMSEKPAGQEEVARWKLDIRVKLGIVVAILSGMLNPMINLSFVYGAPIAKLAEDRGTEPFLALNVIWALGMTAGSVVNAAYCSYVISRQKSWGLMKQFSTDYLIGVLMGILGPVGLLLYGIGSSKIGHLGEVIGWPILASMGILSANFWGAVTGEWTGTGRKPLVVMVAAVVILVAAMFILGWSSRLGGI